MSSQLSLEDPPASLPENQKAHRRKVLSPHIVTLPAVPQDPVPLIFIRLNNRCEQRLTKFRRKNTVDVCLHHAAFLIRLNSGIVFKEPFTDKVRLDSLRSAFNECRLSVDGLTDDVIAFDSKFCGRFSISGKTDS